MLNTCKYSKLYILLAVCVLCLIPYPAFAWVCDWCQSLVDWVVEKATDAALNFLGLDTQDNCEVPSSTTSFCMFCPMFKMIFNAASLIAHKSYMTFGKSLAELVLVFLAVSLALIIIKYVSSMGAKDTSGLMNDILKKVFIGGSIFIILNNNYYYVLDLTLNPLFSVFTKYITPPGQSPCSGSEGVLSSSYLGAGSNVSGGLPGGVDIVCSVQAIEGKINQLFEFGEWAFCRGSGPDRLLFVIPHPIYIMDGILLYLGGILFMVAYPWVMADAVLQLGIAMALLPFAICGFAFAGTKGYLNKVLEWILNSAFVFIFTSFIINLILDYISSVLTDAITNNPLTDPKEIFTDPNRGLAFWGPNMVLIMFILAIGYVYLPLMKDLAKEFAAGSGVGAAQGIGGKVKGEVEGAAKSFGKKAVHTAKETGKWMGNGIIRGGKAGIRMGIGRTVRTFGKPAAVAAGIGIGASSMKVAGIKFTETQDAQGRNFLKREWKNILNGRQHNMFSDKYLTTYLEYDKRGNLIRSKVEFKHNFANKYLIDEKGDINVGALDKLLKSASAANPEVKKAIWAQVAVNLAKKKGIQIGEHFSSRDVILDPTNPGKVIIRQVDYNGKVTDFALDIDMATGRAAIALKRDKVSKSKARKIAIRAWFIKKLGHRTASGGYAFNTFLTGTVREINVDPLTGRDTYDKTRRRRFLFWKKKTIHLRDSETELIFDNGMVRTHTKKGTDGKETTTTTYYDRAKNGHTDYRDNMEKNKIVNNNREIAADLDPSRGGRPEDSLMHGANLFNDLGMTVSGYDTILDTLQRNSVEKSNIIRTNYLGGM